MEVLKQKIKNLKVLVLGDIILDKYYEVNVDRISPEAPVPVAHFKSEKNILGGAANVALNVKNLGAEVFLFGFVGNDDNGLDLERELIEKNIGLLKVAPKDYKTITKIRILSRNTQLLRLDFEDKVKKENYPFLDIKMKLDEIIEKVDLIIVSDYNKGFITQDLVDYLETQNKYVSADTKPGNLSNLRGFNFVKPNFKEALGFAKIHGHYNNYENSNEDVEVLGDFLRNKLGTDILLTRSDRGVSYIGKEVISHNKVSISDVFDVVGAGDTSIAVFSVLNYLGYDLEESLKIMNIAAKITVSNVGTYAPEWEEIITEFNKIVNLK